MRFSAILPALAAVALASSAAAQTAGTITRASVTSLGRESNGAARAAAVSADGRAVAFESDGGISDDGQRIAFGAGESRRRLAARGPRARAAVTSRPRRHS